jgi:hypothetical protein
MQINPRFAENRKTAAAERQRFGMMRDGMMNVTRGMGLDTAGPSVQQPRELAPYYRRQGERLRALASTAAIPDVREMLLDIVQQYEDLADCADADTEDAR